MDSPVKQIVHPKHIDLQDQHGLGWLSGFNEWLVRCGVSFAGHPGDDDGRLLTLHGQVGNTPASEVEVIIDHAPPNRIRIRGLVEERRFKFGAFDLWTEISTVPGTPSIRIDDRLINRSAYAKEYLEPGGERRFQLEVTPLRSASAVDETQATIDRIQGGRVPTIVREPPV